ncbi:MAG: glycoside hydrolase [Nitrosomonadales bacterium]|nr:MAG: glycoside hydrolase [Nitrosomonadales bacterium]
MELNKNTIIGLLLLTASSAMAQEAAETAPAPDATPSTLETRHIAGVSDMLNYAMNLIGINYKYGGGQPSTGFDCSGYVRHVFSQMAGLSLPHNALAMSRLGKKIAPDELKPGDLVFFNTLKRSFSHVGIYVGNNRFIHAPSSGGGVEVVSMQDKYWVQRFNGARRLLVLQLPSGLLNE